MVMAMDVATTSGGGAFTGSTLADKLSKLNASQQSIESILYFLLFFSPPEILYSAFVLFLKKKLFFEILTLFFSFISGISFSQCKVVWCS
jgi:hypothetical protein